jgi:hypothetical protein
MSATFEEAIQPLLDAHAALDADVQEKEAELAELKEKRNRLERAVRAVAPERFVTKKKRDQRDASRARFSSASFDYAVDYLQNRMNGSEFCGAQLTKRDDWGGVGQSSIGPLLQAVHEAGIIRLVRTGKGNSRYYEVIR